MALADLIKTAVNGLLADANGLKESITYDPAGTPKVVNALISRQQSIEEEDPSGTRMLVHRASILISTDAVAGIAAPSQTKSVSFDGKAWAIETLQMDGVASAQLGVVRIEPLITGVVGF